MKIKPQIYAKTLIEALNDKNDLKKVAKNLWYVLQKNKQYKDLPKILECLEEENAKKNGLTIAKVYSENKLSETELQNISKKLSSKNPGIRYTLYEIRKQNWGGITVEINGKIVDLSIEGKVNKLKRVFYEKN